MDTSKETQIINLKEIIQKLWANKWKFVKPLSIVFVLSCIYILSQPRFYTTDAKLAPEMGNNMDGGTLGSIASAFGFNFGDMSSSDAINPLLYPDLMEDNAFVTKLFDIQVETQKGDVKSDYFNYLRKYQKKPWWSGVTNWLLSLLPKDAETGNQTEFNPYAMSRKQTDIANRIRRNISLAVDKKTGVISISITDQDPLVCKTLGDSIIRQLQEFITDYRTNKARVDLVYYQNLTDSARSEYTAAYKRYAAFSDANTNVVLQSYRSKEADLENDMQLKYQTYTALTTQLQAAKAKVQERTPVFTTLKGVAVPTRPAGPKRMIFVLTMMILTGIAYSLYIIRDNLVVTGEKKQSMEE